MKPNSSRVEKTRNRLSILLSFAFGLLLFAHTPPAQAQTSGYWVWNGNAMTRIYDNDSSQFVVREWQVWLYDQEKPTGGADRWGSITARTSEEAMQKLKKNQDFELQYNAFMGKGRVPDQTNTYFNSFGPIAIVDRPQPKPKPAPKPEPNVKPQPVTPVQKPEARWGDPDFHLGQQGLDDDLRKKRDAVRDAWDSILGGKGDIDSFRDTFNRLAQGGR